MHTINRQIVAAPSALLWKMPSGYDVKQSEGSEGSEALNRLQCVATSPHQGRMVGNREAEVLSITERRDRISYRGQL